MITTEMQCAKCGSQRVLRDAWASWNSKDGFWELHGDPMDQAYCEDCDGETEIVERLTRDDGLEVRHDLAGFYLLTHDEAEHEDAGNQSVGFDGRPHFVSVGAALTASVS